MKEITEVGEKLGAGSQKDVYYSVEYEDRCIGLIRSEDIGRLSPHDVAEKEKDDITQLAEIGLPVVEVRDIVRFGDQYGVERDLVVNAIDSEDVILSRKSFPDSTSFNKNVISSCNEMIEILKEKASYHRRFAIFN
ncbi:hypothetical protein [Piscirickettsia litoralis]|uniref:Type III secretion system effector HopBF1-like domain-containing protein n=1 Tax=Piscirickettsia litoralis TaxID=1891921 RepID=A0ABX3A1Y3_9GAMM|nr:hypothetical protein [Piscirickettsia litoralis]ODN42872.1 hypothetical protein BGC07_07970 [Piscirickettsia litoralis]